MTNIIGQRFAIEHEIDSGAFGTVYRGIDTQNGETVAIKLLKREIVANNPDIIERFAREAEALRRLNHPNIVKVLATITEGEDHYLVMEFVSGGSLRDLLQNGGPLPITQILEIALDLSDALTRAHRLKIIHRDLKPANVLLAEDGTPRLTDFGVARISDTTQMTATGAIVGTLAYLSPEAINGDPIDTRSDIWAFGIMLYELLTGQRPFTGETSGAVLHGILDKSPPDIFQFRDDAPWTLIGLIYWMLEKEPDQRINSARLVGAMLENILSGAELPYDWHEANHKIAPSSEWPTPPEGTATHQFFTQQWQTGRPPHSPPRVPVTADGPSLSERPISRADWDIRQRPQLDHPPRIYIAYRREDSIAVTGRLYDRLAGAFGADHIVRDPDDAQTLEMAIAACEVMLVVIGSQWATVTDEHGLPRLADPDDRIRREVEIALAQGGVLVVPVLVNNTWMPHPDDLPPSLVDLTRQNAAIVRNDPDFNRDVQWLIQQLKRSFDYPGKDIDATTAPNVPAVSSPPVRVIVLTVIGLLIALSVTLLLVASNLSAPTVPDAPTAEAASALNLPPIAPIAQGERMVLVADFEALTDETRDVQRFILDDLRAAFEETPALSIIRIRAYPGIITSNDDAQRIAEHYLADVIIWGNYDEDRVEAFTQLGDWTRYANEPFTRDQVTTITNARYHMGNERAETLAHGVVGVLNSWVTYTDDAIEIAVHLPVLELVDKPPAEVQGNTTAAAFHRFIRDYIPDPQAALEAIDSAITLDANVPLLYTARSIVLLRLNRIEEAREDSLTALRIGPDGWMAPHFMLGNIESFYNNDPVAAVPHYERVIEIAPDSWGGYAQITAPYYLLRDYNNVVINMTEARERGAPLNYPYVFGMPALLHLGRFQEALHMLNFILNEFPDPTQTERVVAIMFSSNTEINDLLQATAAFGHMILEQWGRAIETSELAIANGGDQLTDLYLIQGLSYCNLDQHAEAEAAYTRGLEVEPEYILLHLLRADVRRKQGDWIGLSEDILTISRSDQAATWLALAQDPALGCETVFTIDPDDYFNQAPET